MKKEKQQLKNKKSDKFKFLIVIFTFSFFIFNFTYAQYGFTDFLGNVPGQELGIQWLFKLLSQLTCYFYQLAIIIFGVMLVIYGLMFFKSRGSPQGMTEARKALTWGLVGGFVIFAVFTIIMSVASFIGADFALLRIITCQ
ncbi:MAG: hypothetical protein A3B86_04280 [Candidatus Yanofskybacteria bacterium RIFCSPHIGHO2_02_FULL_38_22b]|uniref:Uncharacterized protein n=1 Tax=Candidatus Yanofskybacteria bacterium RIFCSPHIGHO2_02_FULL_38_22b TaxID=1802673 RepID=A0A1F8F244_9BACT|nr:MAG: hypothetical protein A2816_02050 [Candidatus Yanofskybacteria bacterium RIFCSPHIGHO2_01_FULL_39_44]OGN06306.1 MAG: hypothetical protein A3B86_04280 [Candidatus Yanofskybacteria bacterium RIFCSPHIGHO2_02_FULL_38_22b]OGN19725.1 MAG: hypothetical protein A2910_04015 [Candidatus Yanofskybacteria bacterium RIFCSPLOWO2_01_FULL_39_28]